MFFKGDYKQLLELANLTKEYATPRGPLPILSDINLTFQRGDAVAVMGPSGSGKSTLLYVVGALEPPTSGIVTLDKQNPFELSEPAMAAFRNQKIGFVFQDHCLLPHGAARESGRARARVGGASGDYVGRAKRLRARVGFPNPRNHPPPNLWGGKKRRWATARALTREPLLLLCDEPTGNLDRQSA